MKNKALQMALQIIAGIAAVALIVGIYITRLNSVISSNLLNTISEMAQHDKRGIEAFIDSSWNKLYGISERVLEDGSTLDEIYRELNLETATNHDFMHIYLLAEDGTVITDEFRSYDPRTSSSDEDVDFLPLFHDGRERFVLHWNDQGEEIFTSFNGAVYGVRLENEYIGSQKIIAIIGVSDISEIESYIIVDSFVKDGERRGYCSIVNLQGRFVIDSRASTPLGTGTAEDMFELVNAGSHAAFSNEEMLEKMENQETFNFSFVDHNGVTKIVYFTPFMDDVDWYFLQIVDRVAFSEQSNVFVTLSVIFLSIILIVLIFMLIMVFIVRGKSAAAHARAKAQSEFLSNMSHEIRTPLNGIIGLNHLMITHIDDKNYHQDIKTWLKKSHDTANYLLSLVNDILDMSKLQAGKADIINEPVMIESIIDDVYSMQYDNIRSRNVAFIVERDIKAPCVMGDATRIKQILMNVVGNAAKFTPAGGAITLSVTQDIQDGGDVTTIYRCADTGIGMSQEFAEKIFDAFSQERNKNSESIKGTGLGMSICKLLSKAMGGDITVESEMNEGSIFTVTLPSTVAEPPENYVHTAPKISENVVVENTPQADEPTSPKPSSPAPKDGERPLKVLVAEDNELNAEILIDILTESGYEVVHGENGERVLEIFANSAEYEFDIILMDMQMPVMDGCEAARAIRKLKRADAGSIYIYACTANTFKEDRDKALGSGMNDFLTKPIDVTVLEEKLSKIKK